MNWINLSTEQQLTNLKELSDGKSQLIFKHSTRCNISSMAKNRLERSAEPTNVDFYYLDLIAHRQLSYKIAEEFNIEHQSPQVLLIKNKKCIYNESHNGIAMEEILQQALLQ